MGSWNCCSEWVRGAETCMIKSCLLVFSIHRLEPPRFRCLLFWNSYCRCLLFWNPSVRLRGVLLRPRRTEHNTWTCHPVALLRVTVQRRRCEGPHRRALCATVRGATEHTRSGRSRRLLLLPCRDARVLPSFCPSVPPCVSLYGLESKHRHCPRPDVHSGHLSLYILLYLESLSYTRPLPLVLTVWSECLCTVFSYCCASACGPPSMVAGSPRRRLWLNMVLTTSTDPPQNKNQ